MRYFFSFLAVAASLFSMEQKVYDTLFPKKVTRGMKYITLTNVGSTGQLGNQCYRIAAAVTYCVENDYFFAITPMVKNLYPEVFHNIPLIIPASKRNKVINLENKFKKHPKIRGSICISGFPNSNLYFEKQKDLVREIFKPTAERERSLKEKFSYVFENQDKYVALHLRTFINKEDPHVFKTHKHYYAIWATSPEYYEKAMDQFPDDVTYIVCTDYVPAAKEMLATFEGKKFIFTDNSLEEDFYLFSMMDNAIISNSSFSFFAAYMNPNPNQKVVMPAYCKILEVSDPSWIRVPYDYNEKNMSPIYDPWYAIGMKYAKLTGLIK